MIEKIDRPEAPPPYQITRAKDAKEDQHKPPNQREEQEKRYQKQLTEKWDKFDRRTTTIKPLRAARGAITRCLFRSVSLHSGVGILAVDVYWKDGRTVKNALVLLSHLEQFVRLKKFSPGQEVPDEFWSAGSTVEFGIIQTISAGGGIPLQGGAAGAVNKQHARRKSHWLFSFGITDREGQKIKWGIVALYLFFITIAVVAFVFEAR